jgi:protein involved in polysaccharide export with SLBB domain
MRKLLLLILLVIVLVSLNWFRQVLAQDFRHLSDADKEALEREYQDRLPSGTEPIVYRSPSLYGSQDSLVLPVHISSAVHGKPDSGVSKADVARVKLQGFDELRPFGKDLFRAPPGEAIPPDDIASSDDYILGPGDNVIIYLWGRVEQEYQLTIDREGKVFVPKVGELVVWGMTLDSFRTYVKKKFSAVYSEFEMTVSLGRIRSIRIYLTGEVERPGAYTVSSLTSLFNALYLAGGPSENGSMRNIKLMRNGEAIALVDLYEFLLKGDNSPDVKLESGDAVFVPVAGSRVAVRGRVKRPAWYELKGGERAMDLLELAGNADADAYLDRIMLERISGLNEWQVLDLNLGSDPVDSLDNIFLTDGDRLTVYSIFDFKKNMVAVFGHVKHPGYYERNDSTRVSSLIAHAQLQEYDVCYKRANLFRRYSDWRTGVIAIDLRKIKSGDIESDLLLQDRDSLHVYSLDEVHWDKYVYIEGEVKKPGKYPLYDRMTAADLVFLAGSYTRSASLLQAEIARIDALGQVSLEYVSLDEPSLESVCLAEDDRLYIRRIPEWRLRRAVNVEGEVVYPGEYILSSSEETLYELLQRAGGFTRNAFPKGLIFERQSIGRQLRRSQIPQLLEKSNPIVQDSLGNVRREVIFDYEPQSVNRVIIDTEEILHSKGGRGNIVLEPGDRIFVPSVPTGISVMGAVGASGTLKFTENKDVKHYIKRAGNYTEQADKDGTRLVKAGGEVYSGGGTLGEKVDVGDVIVVPTKIEKDHNWEKTLTVILTATTSLLTSVLIIDRL